MGVGHGKIIFVSESPETIFGSIKKIWGGGGGGGWREQGGGGDKQYK